TFTIDDDYEMDYINGGISVLSSGSMVNSTGYLISYELDPKGIDISGLTDLILPISLEWPVNKTPMETVGFWKWGDTLFIVVKAGGGTPPNLVEEDEIRVYYHGEYTAPTDSVAGNFPVYFHEIMIKGVVAYALFMKAREQNLQALTDLDSARTNIAKIDGDAGALTTAAAAANTAFDLAVTDILKVEGSAGEPVDDALTALGLVAAEALLINAALDHVLEELLTAGSQSGDDADEYLNKGDAFLNAINTGGPGVPLEHVQFALAKVQMAQTWVQEALGRAQHVQALVAQANANVAVGQLILNMVQGRVSTGIGFIREVEARIAAQQQYVQMTDRFLLSAERDQELSDRLLIDARERHDDYWNILTDRVQQARPHGRSASFQYQPAFTGRSTFMAQLTGDES
ncbi:hypothetical protein LCGC14_1259280, partial [marine sediment metagenome]